MSDTLHSLIWTKDSIEIISDRNTEDVAIHERSTRPIIKKKRCMSLGPLRFVASYFVNSIANDIVGSTSTRNAVTRSPAQAMMQIYHNLHSCGERIEMLRRIKETCSFGTAGPWCKHMQLVKKKHVSHCLVKKPGLKLISFNMINPTKLLWNFEFKGISTD